MCSTWLIQFTYAEGNGYAIVRANSAKQAQEVFLSQTKFQSYSVTVLHMKDLNYFGGDMQIVYEGSASTFGKSAYDLAIEQGFTGSLDDFLKSLKGEKGDRGDTGPRGPKGDPGTTDYNGLTNKPTKLSDFDNDEGFGTYTKPSTGIPSTDLSDAVQTSLGKAESALQSSDIASMEVTTNKKATLTGNESSTTYYPTTKAVADYAEAKTNKVTSLSSSSTDSQYPSAKCMYDIVGNIETLLAAI